MFFCHGDKITFMFWLLIFIFPESQLSKPQNKFIKVDLPDPVFPTTPILSPLLILIFTSFKIFSLMSG